MQSERLGERFFFNDYVLTVYIMNLLVKLFHLNLSNLRDQLLSFCFVHAFSLF